ncbi:sigma-70 family RNA polymerase sigma factor [Streptomyces filamentosus]|uniref:sigma-70 family RNA polymerase sigma factor n=1 Tax=Streptomyces filamentosus TaxID=67294 RepID=UPI0037CD074C
MHSDEQRTTALVEAARAGDPHARDELVRACLPLVHNVVGRALDGHADTDDVVQETLVRALDGLPGLRDPARFRSWLVAIAMNGVRRRWRERRQAPVPGLDRAAELADPAGDFTDLTILRLGLTGQRRDVARATRWLDEDDHELLSLWWLEAAGELTRAELAEALGLAPAHAAVRVQRMRERLETGRAVVGALDTDPRCPGLAGVLASWDGRPSPLWRKRIARHLRDCRTCAAGRARRGGLAPVEGLLVGLGLVPPAAGLLSTGPDPLAADPVGWTQQTAAPSQHGGAAPDPGPVPGSGTDQGPVSGTDQGSVSGADLGFAGAGGADPGLTTVLVPLPGTGTVAAAGARGHAAPFWSPARRAGAAGVAAVAVLGALVLTLPERPEPRRPAAAPPVTTPAPAPTPTPTPTPAPSTAAPAATRPPARPAPTTPAPPPTPARTVTPPDPGERVTELVNRERARAGCAPLRTDPRLVAAARAYARDMTARGYYGHASPEGEYADARITAAGYDWSAWAENLAQGQTGPAAVVDGWMGDAGHRRNLLDCSYRDTGVAAVPGPRGTVWVEKLAAPAG